MSITEFIRNIEEEFEEVAEGTIQPETVFRTLNGWSSMLALIIIAKIDSAYNVNITAEELAGSKTIQDLFNITADKKQLS